MSSEQAAGRHGAREPRRRWIWAPSRRTVLASAASASALLVLVAGAGVAQARSTVTLEVDGVSQPIVTWGSNVASVLDAAGVKAGAHDLVQPELAASVDDGATVVVRTAHPYSLAVDGRARTIWSTSASADAILADSAALGSSVSLAADRSSVRGTAVPLVTRARTVAVVADGRTTSVAAREGEDAAAVLGRAGVEVRPNDRVSVSNGADGALTITVARVSRGDMTSDIPVAYAEQTVASGDLFVGESKVTTKGVNGVARRTQWTETVDGAATTAVTTAEQVTTAPTTQIRSTGTKEATPQALLIAGIDPKAQLESGTDEYGDAYTLYRAQIGSLSSVSEIEAIINAIPDQADKVAAAAAAQRAGLAISYTGQDPKEIAAIQVAARGWGSDQYQCLVNLWNRESHWNPYAENASSGAYGIPQALPGSKMASAGADWRTNPATQITWGLGYIAGRYGTPCAAWGHSNGYGWY